MDNDERPYRFERYTPDQLPALLTLHDAVYGPGLTAGRLQRKFASPVPDHEVIGYLAYSAEGEPAAYYGIFPVLLRHGGEHIVAGQSGDTMTHPKHRKRGLFVELGRRTYAAAANEGIAFVFGFPNLDGSYPGFVKHLAWTHRRTMRSYWLFVPTIPFHVLLRNRPALTRRIDSVQRHLITRLHLACPTLDLPSSVLDNGEAGALRDQAVLDYKEPGIFTFTQSGVRVLFRLDEHLSVGDLVAQQGAKPWRAIARLMAVAVLSGRFRISYHVSPGSASDRLLRGHLPVKDGLPYGHVTFAEGMNPEEFNFTFIDYDTF
ncbi:MAG: GNAT family N-acetyltransferase [Aquihabitans sp.]